jgi:hypothetical protein
MLVQNWKVPGVLLTNSIIKITIAESKFNSSINLKLDFMATSSKDYSDLVDATHDLKERGYTSDFKIIENACSDEDETQVCQLQSLASEKVYTSDQLKIREHYRFEGPSNPDDMSVLYAIECEGGEKGTVIDAFGTYSSRRLSEFFRSIPIETDSSQAV